MSNLPSLTPKELIKILEQRGFAFDRSKGSYQVYYNADDKKQVVVPMHKKEMPKGTLLSILKQAGIDKNELSK